MADTITEPINGDMLPGNASAVPHNRLPAAEPDKTPVEYSILSGKALKALAKAGDMKAQDEIAARKQAKISEDGLTSPDHAATPEAIQEAIDSLNLTARKANASYDAAGRVIPKSVLSGRGHKPVAVRVRSAKVSLPGKLNGRVSESCDYVSCHRPITEADVVDGTTLAVDPGKVLDGAKGACWKVIERYPVSGANPVTLYLTPADFAAFLLDSQTI